MKTEREFLFEIASQLDLWAVESINGGWSTHQVDPMRNLALEIYAFLGKKPPNKVNPPADLCTCKPGPFVATKEYCTKCGKDIRR